MSKVCHFSKFTLSDVYLVNAWSSWQEENQAATQPEILSSKMQQVLQALVKCVGISGGDVSFCTLDRVGLWDRHLAPRPHAIGRVTNDGIKQLLQSKK